MRYFFHIRDHGETILDEEGDEFDHPEDAAASAVQAVQELASARIKDGLVIDDQRLDLCDENGVAIERTPDDVELRPDGAHFDVHSATWFWNTWLAGQLGAVYPPRA